MTRGYEFRLSFLKDICVVTAKRKGIIYFRSGEDKYQMPLETFNKQERENERPKS